MKILVTVRLLASALLLNKFPTYICTHATTSVLGCPVLTCGRCHSARAVVGYLSQNALVIGSVHFWFGFYGTKQLFLCRPLILLEYEWCIGDHCNKVAYMAPMYGCYGTLV